MEKGGKEELKYSEEIRTLLSRLSTFCCPPTVSPVKAVKRLFVSPDAEPVAPGAEASHCCNCGAELQGQFCHHCGQSADVERLTLTTLFRKTVKRALDLDNAFLRTLIGMTRHPGRLASRYVAGWRKPYTNPLKFLVFTITLTVLLRWGAAKFGLWTIPNINNPLVNNRVLFYPFLQTVLAGTLTLLFYRSERNLAENIAFSLFMGGPAYFYMTVAEFINYHVFGRISEIQFIAHLSAYTLYLLYGATRFYDQRLLFVVPKIIVVVPVTVVSILYFLYLTILS